VRTRLAVALFVALGVARGFAQAPARQAPADPAAFFAYRADPATPPETRRHVVEKAIEAGLTPVEDWALERQGLLVFKADDPTLVDKTRTLFTGMLSVPIREFRGVLSVPTGNFYLRFRQEVSQATARKRVEALGFKVLTPPTDRSSLLVVERSGLPVNRDRELALLKNLSELLYVAPNDIPLASAGTPRR
jgi:hypothetical protein